MRPIAHVLLLLLLIPPLPAIATAADAPLLDLLADAVERSFADLSGQSDAPLYYLQYAVTENHNYSLSIRDGGAGAPERSRDRYLDVDLRVGSFEEDHTHEIRGGSGRDNYAGRRLVRFPLDDDEPSIRGALWLETEYQYHKAQERYTKVVSNRQVMVEKEDLSDDFSPYPAQEYIEPVPVAELDEDHWRGVMKRVGGYLSRHEDVLQSRVAIAATDQITYLVNSEGSRLQHGNRYIRLTLSIDGMAGDGMELHRNEIYSVADIAHLPAEAQIMVAAERLVAELEALIEAPVVEPFIGPAILRNRACGVFFHEIFGHRIEGHRQKSESEGQTFTKKVNQQILPEFISVYDDPTLERMAGKDLRGFYRYDDEGVPAQRVTVVEKGILRNFLTTRSPIENYPESNGHARRQHGYDVVARQGNLIIESEREVPYDELRAMLIEECRRQGKPYGLVFDDISGGFTMTGRYGTQAFKVTPLLVYRVYADGRPDEVVRGVDVVGTPLTSFSKIIMAADDSDVFNGTCGAESGSVPVSAVSPSVLVSEIEVEKKSKGQNRPPILPPPARIPQ